MRGGAYIAEPSWLGYAAATRRAIHENPAKMAGLFASYTCAGDQPCPHRNSSTTRPIAICANTTSSISKQHTAGRKQVDFSNADLRGVDLRNVDRQKLILRDAYLRDADLRGLDLRHLDMEGCSLHGAKISGTYFPDNLSPQEIANSVQFGTRLRTNIL